MTKASGLQDALDDAEYSGSLVSLLEEGEAFVKRNSHKGWFKASDHRVELPDYPDRSVTEGIVNALIHRDYLATGSEVHIDIYDDRLEIYSPGGMFDGINIQDRDILHVPSSRRNPMIADVFSRLNLMERRGSGFRKIIADYQSQHRYSDELAPVFLSEYNAFFLTLKNLNYPLSGKGDEKGDKKAMKKGDEIEARVEAAYAAIIADPTITVRALSMQLQATQKQTELALKRLKESGRIRREGTARGGKWIV